MTMVTAFKFDNLVTACITTCQTDRSHGRFSTRVGQTNQFKCWHDVTDNVDECRSMPGRRTKAQAVYSGILYSLNNRRMCMAQNHWPPRPNVVYIAFTIDIIEISPLRLLNKNWRSAYAIKCTHW